MSKLVFDQLVTLYRAIDFDIAAREGTLLLESEDIRGLLETVLADEDGEYGIAIAEGDPDHLQVGQTVRLFIDSPRTGLGLLATDLAGLLGIRKARIEEPRRYFLARERFNKADAIVPDNVIRYRRVLAFIGLLKESAAYLDESKAELIYIADGKFEISLTYSVDDLMKADTACIDRLIASIENDTHKEQRLSILGTAAVEIAQSFPPNERFPNLLAHLPQLYERFSDGYRLFVSSFSYEKVKDELEAAKVEYTGKIHKVFTDIQNQVLGIPVATVIVATQMKAASQVGYEFWVNTGVLLGCYVFAVLMGLLIYNQINTLVVLEQEIARQKNQFEKDHKDILQRLSSVFATLDSRLRSQRYILVFVAFILGTGLALSTVAYLSITKPAKDWANTTFIQNWLP
ncbi:hypothetical protein E4K72_08065 [Oxalobacteraceae bacterium OM1]|nr:hypothetical protein E4K72_08065 [Oxalobacteraceae bacterium OM1]